MPPALRLFPDPADPSVGPPAGPPTDEATVTLGALLAACGVETADCPEGRVWLHDFAAEPVRVGRDLADLLHVAALMNAEPAGPLGRAA